MNKTGIDQAALVKMFSQATAQQSEAVRRAVCEATLKAMQSRELTLENIRKVLKAVTQAASKGAGSNPALPAEIESLLSHALSGMDAALVQAVQAHRRALQQFVDQGADLREKQLKGALSNIEKLEDALFKTVGQAAATAAEPVQVQWQRVLGAMKLEGSGTGAQASASVEQLLGQVKAALRDGRAAALHGSQLALDSFAALASGVLIGMSEALQPTAAAAKTTRARGRA